MQQMRPFFNVLYARQSRLLTTCDLSTKMEAEVRAQGSESAERGGESESAYFFNDLSVSVCIFGRNVTMCSELFFLLET